MPSSYHISFTCVIVIYRFNGAADEVVSSPYNKKEPVVSVAEYRKLLNDNTTPDEKVRERIEYLAALCRNVAREEIKSYVSEIKNKPK